MKPLVIVPEEDPYAFMTEPEKSVRTYDSTLSHPGHLCTNCRSFVAGGLEECPICTSSEGVIFESVAFRALNRYIKPLCVPNKGF